MSLAPLFQDVRPSQYSETVLPIGVNAPSPVTTTRLSSIKTILSFRCTVQLDQQWQFFLLGRQGFEYQILFQIP